MARARILLAAVLAVAALAMIAGPVSASVPAANAKFCKAADKIGTASSSNQPTKSEAKTAIRGFKNAAKYAPPKVKTAINNIAKYLGLVAGTSNAADLAKIYTGSGFKNYTKSITTYIGYYTQNCIGGS